MVSSESKPMLLGDSQMTNFNPKTFAFFKKPTYYDMSEIKLEGMKKFAEIIQWGRKNPVKFCERFFGIEFLDYQKYVFMMSWITPNVVWCMSRSAGKALDLDTRIPTPTGDKTMKDIHVGDYVFDENGYPTMVTYESPIYTNHQCYKVTFDDGENIIADADHNWYVYTNLETNDANHHADWVVRTTKEMYERSSYGCTEKTETAVAPRYEYKVSQSGVLHYETQNNLRIPPYILGLWLSGGTGAYINIPTLNSTKVIKNIESNGYTVRSVSKIENTLRSLEILSPDGISLEVILKKENLFNCKYISKDYIYTSVNNRIQLLHGMMDADVMCDSGEYNFCQYEKYISIIDGMNSLLNSLGIRKNKSNKKSIIGIEKIKSKPVKCIQVASNSHLYLCGHNNTVTHNTTLGSPFLMAKTMLIPKFEAYILSSTGSQSIGMMKKIEAIAKKEIASFTGLTDVFLNELVKSANSEGFRHDPASYSYKLYSGSSLATINSNFDGSRGHRSRLNFYDEASYVSEDMFSATLPFVTQNSDFALGGDVDVTLLPPNFPNQIVYASSAGSMDDFFYKKYKEAAMHSFAGDKNYFCADIDCEIVLHATYNGKIYPVPLLTQEKIDSEMKTNPTKATREYMNKFDSDLGDDVAVRKSQILRNSEVRPPMLINDDNSMMVICYDPAKKRDNSFVLIGKLHKDDRRGWLLDVVNGVNLIDKETQKPLTTPEQVAMLRELIIRYNGYDAPDYKNIYGVFIDAGSGGGATQICDLLFDNFYEENHKGEKDFEHHGMIDANYEYAIPYVKRYPDAIDIIRLKEPVKYKSIMYTQLCEMIDQDLISFTSEYDYHGNLTILDEENGEVVEKVYKLSVEEEIGLKQLDAMKEELTHMYKYRASNGNVRYDLAPGYENILHDDRAYCMALMGHALFELRSKDQVRQKKKSSDIGSLVDRLPMSQGKIFKSH